MKKVTAEEGIVAIGYDKQYGEYRRLYQFAKSLIFTPSSGLYSCPIAMTDGAAKTIQVNKCLINDITVENMVITHSVRLTFPDSGT